jgi:hypothetical protein
MEGVERADLLGRPKDDLVYCSFNGDKRQREEGWEDCVIGVGMWLMADDRRRGGSGFL